MMEGLRSEWEFEHIYPDGLRPGVLVRERLLLREGDGLCKWKRNLDTSDAKGVQAQGEVWRRNSVKNVCFAARVGDPSREFSLFGERRGMKNRASLVWLWEKAPVLTGSLCTLTNPLTATLLFCGGLALALLAAFPHTDYRYVMGKAPNTEYLWLSTGLSLLSFATTCLCFWWLRLLGPKAIGEEGPFAAFRPTSASTNRWVWQSTLNGIFMGLFSVWFLFLMIALPIMAVQGLKVDFCITGGCESKLGGAVDGTCGVGRCSCGSHQDLSCTKASSLTPYCRTVDAPICSANENERSGIHAVLLISLIGTLISTAVLCILWLVNHAAIVMNLAAKDTSTTVSQMKPQNVPYHRITLTFEGKQQGQLIFTISADEDLSMLANLLMPDTGARTDYSPFGFAPSFAPPPLATFPGIQLLPDDLDELHHWPTMMQDDRVSEGGAPADLQWD
eukprot:TRINITY_DN88540_c0_g1_i1.p1 TRINITY_DN88540_c0_g1~~TRINITY_DN88540_c0_g1_i1.p1  ORF type:complete len:447 (+),score=59.28 TRINITY_DN88540_c0_g1_i1:100-1440(+)